MQRVTLQLERLRRHYEVAVHSNDTVALLDLAHTLRIWTELKGLLPELAPRFSSATVFKTAIPVRKILNAARGYRYVFANMPGGVRTYACAHDQLAFFPRTGPQDSIATCGFEMKRMETHMELSHYCLVYAQLDESARKALTLTTQTRCTYSQWLGSEAVRLCYQTKDNILEKIAISREMIIKRVANTLNASHVSGGDSTEHVNQFDEPVQHLLQYRMGGLCLPYFILVKIAQDILTASQTYLSPGAEASTT